MATMYQIHLAETLYRFLKDPNKRIYLEDIDWDDFLKCLKSKKILPDVKDMQDNTKAGEKILSAYLPDIRVGNRNKGGIELRWQLREREKEDIFAWRHNTEPALLKGLFSQNKYEKSCLSFCIFCFRKIITQTQSPYVWICNKRIDISANINTIEKVLFFEEKISIFVKSEEEKQKIPTCEEWLSEENGWNISADSKTITQLKNKFSYVSSSTSQAKIEEERKEFFFVLTGWIFEEIEKNPYGSYLINKIQRSPQEPDPQVINFLKAMVKIHISYDKRFLYTQARRYKGFNIAIETNKSFVKAAVLPIRTKLRMLGDAYEDFSQEDYMRILFAIARSCRETPSHITSRLLAKTNLNKFFGDNYTEMDWITIVNRLAENGILEVPRSQCAFLKTENAEVKKLNQPSVIQFKNKLFRLYIDGYGSSRYTDESIVDFILLQSKDNIKFNHLANYEDLTFFSASYFEAAKDKDQVIKHLLAESTDFDVAKRKLQAPAIHVLSMLLVEYDYLLTGKIRKEAFVSVFGKNFYPHQREFFDSLMLRECYKKQFESIRADALKVNGGYAKSDPLFFFYESAKEKEDAYSKAATLHEMSYQLINTFENPSAVLYDKLMKLFSTEEIETIKSDVIDLKKLKLKVSYQRTDRVKEKLIPIVQELYAIVLHEIKIFNTDQQNWNLKYQDESSNVVRKIQTAEYLLNAFLNIAKHSYLPDDQENRKENLIRVKTLAQALDHAKDRATETYELDGLEGKGFYGTTAVSRVKDVLEEQQIKVGSIRKFQEYEDFFFCKQLKEKTSSDDQDDYNKAITIHHLSWRLPNATESLSADINDKITEWFSSEKIKEIKSNTKDIDSLSLRDVYLYTKKAQGNLTSAVRSLYAVVLNEIRAFDIKNLSWEGELQEASNVVEKIYTAEYLLYAFSDIGRFCHLPKDTENLNCVATLAVAVDYAKKKVNKTYNSVEWDGKNMYMTCASARVFSVFDAQHLSIDFKVVLSETKKIQYLKWLKNELAIGYESGSLRYAMFMIRLLSYTDMDMSIVRNLILYLDHVKFDGNAFPSILYCQKRYEKRDGETVANLIGSINLEKRKFKSCFASTKFLDYDCFSSDLNKISEKYGLVFKVTNYLEKIKADDQEIPFTEEDCSLWYIRENDCNFPYVKDIEIQNATILDENRWSDNETKIRNLLINGIVDDVVIRMSARLIAD